MEKYKDWNWIDKEEVGSTNDEALALSKEVTDGKYIISAKMQNQGRGRRGRSWIGLEGNLFMSLLVKVPLSQLGEIIFVVSLSLLESIKNLFPDIDIKLKWPNDVLVKGCKVSGILMEKGEGDYLVIGIGVNIAQSPKIEGLIYPAISLADNGYKTDRITLLKEYLSCFDKNFDILQNYGFEAIRSAWLSHVKGLGEQIEVRGTNENKIGIFKDIDKNGFLLLETNKGIEKICAGDIFYI